jgi:hypothetical protein
LKTANEFADGYNTSMLTASTPKAQRGFSGAWRLGWILEELPPIFQIIVVKKAAAKMNLKESGSASSAHNPSQFRKPSKAIPTTALQQLDLSATRDRAPTPVPQRSAQIVRSPTPSTTPIPQPRPSRALTPNPTSKIAITQTEHKHIPEMKEGTRQRQPPNRTDLKVYSWLFAFDAHHRSRQCEERPAATDPE